MKLMRASSLRLRLLAALLLAIVGFWAAWFAFQAMLMSHQHTNRWDASMQAVGQQILLSLHPSQPAGAVEPTASNEPSYTLPPQIRVQPELMSFQVWTNDGRSVLRSSGAPLKPWVPLRFDKPEGFTQASVDELDWRIYTLSDASGRIQVQVGKSQSQLLGVMALWLGTSVGTVLLLMALLGGVTWLIICWTLSPVDRISSAIRQRAPLDLTPLPAHGLPSEVRPLVESFNAQLLRLESALQGERRFLADAAHELRTPLAALMAQVQLVQSATTLEQSHASLAPLVSGIERSARLTEQLLDQARLDAVTAPQVQRPVALHEIVSLVVRDFDNSAQMSGQRLLLHADPCNVKVDVDAVGVLLRNLLDNAVRYAGPGARIEIMCREQQPDARVCLSVRDDGPGVPEAERTRIFDRFYRMPDSPGRGSGIGLSLVARIANLHRASLKVTDGIDGRGLCVSVLFENEPRLARSSATPAYT